MFECFCATFRMIKQIRRVVPSCRTLKVRKHKANSGTSVAHLYLVPPGDKYCNTLNVTRLTHNSALCRGPCTTCYNDGRLCITTLPSGVCSDDYDFPRSWLLPVLRSNIRETELAFFASYFLPLAARLRTKGESPY